MIIVFVLFYEAMVTAITALGCKLAQKRHRKPRWYLAFVAAIIVATFISVSSGWHYLTHPANWSWERRHDMDSLSAVVYGFLLLAGMALPVALFVVYFFRKKYKESSHVS